jgi:hypothetical protein
MPSINHLFVVHWPSIGHPLAIQWPSTGLSLAFHWPSTGRPLAFNWPYTGLPPAIKLVSILTFHMPSLGHPGRPFHSRGYPLLFLPNIYPPKKRLRPQVMQNRMSPLSWIRWNTGKAFLD